MKNELAEILGYLDTDEEMDKLSVRVLELCKDGTGARQLINELNIALSNTGNVDYTPFYNLFMACAFCELNDLNRASNHMIFAKAKFRMGTINHSLASWILGLLYRDNGKIAEAIQELKNAKVSLEKLENLPTKKDDKKKLSQTLRSKIDNVISALSGQPQAAAGAPPPLGDGEPNWGTQNAPPERSEVPTTIHLDVNQPTFAPQIPITVNKLVDVNQPTFAPQFNIPANVNPKSEEPAEDVVDAEGYLAIPWLPILNSVQAGADGPCWADPIKGNQMEISRINLHHDICSIHLIRSVGKRLTLDRGRALAWAPVMGHSMNASQPVTVEENDYVLFESSYGPSARPLHDNDIVIIANPGGAGYSYSVKRYSKNENVAKSETTETGDQYKPIPIDEDHRVIGIVVAIAKRCDK